MVTKWYTWCKNQTTKDAKRKVYKPQKRCLQLDNDPHEDVSLLSNRVPEDQVALVEEQVVIAEMGEFDIEELVLSDNKNEDNR